MRHRIRDLQGEASSSTSGGITLLELVISIVVLTTVGLGTITLLVPTARQSRLSRELQTANLEARRVIERILSTPFSSLTAAYPYGVEIPVPDLPQGKIIVTYADPAADPLQVHLDLSWESPDLGTSRFTFDTARTE
jgi:Tfp pilus assembly protein PilV